MQSCCAPIKAALRKPWVARIISAKRTAKGFQARLPIIVLAVAARAVPELEWAPRTQIAPYKVKREIIINASPLEVRVALLEDGALSEFYLERNERGGLAGNIYKGKVTRVLPGMQAAFVDIGLDKAGFLHVSDFQTDAESLGSIAEAIGEDDVETEPVVVEVRRKSTRVLPQSWKCAMGRRGGIGCRRSAGSERFAARSAQAQWAASAAITYRAATQAWTGNYRPGRQGADWQQRGAADFFHLVTGPSSGLHAEQQAYRDFTPDRKCRGARAAARCGQGVGRITWRLHCPHRVRRREQTGDSAGRLIPD